VISDIFLIGHQAGGSGNSALPDDGSSLAALRSGVELSIKARKRVSLLKRTTLQPQLWLHVLVPQLQLPSLDRLLQYIPA